MSDNVVRLLTNNALAIDPAELAERLRALASEIELGECGQVERVCVLLNGENFACRSYGRAGNRAELIGILEYAKAAIIQGDD